MDMYRSHRAGGLSLYILSPFSVYPANQSKMVLGRSEQLTITNNLASWPARQDTKLLGLGSEECFLEKYLQI